MATSSLDEPEADAKPVKITQGDIERARRFYEQYTAPEPSLTLMILRGEFGEASKNRLIYRRAKEYAIDREHGMVSER